jgi:hypothetical protein
VPVPFIRIDPATGQIVASGYMAAPHIVARQEQGDAYHLLEGHPERDYFDLTDGAVKSREANGTTQNGSTFSGLPIGGKILCLDELGNAETVNVTQSTFEASFVLPGTYQLTVSSVQVLPKTFTITVP